MNQIIVLLKSFVIYVNDLNRAPTDIGVSSLTFPESVSASSTIATLSAVDSDTSDTHVFSLINGNGSNDADNSSFTVSGTSLIINSTADYESKAAYNIYLNVLMEPTIMPKPLLLVLPMLMKHLAIYSF